MSAPVVTTYERVSELPLTIEDYRSKAASGPSARVRRASRRRSTCAARGEEGLGEDVTYDPDEQREQQARGPSLPLAGEWTFDSSPATSASSTSSRPASRSARLPPLPPLGRRERGARPRAAPGRPLARRRARPRAPPGHASWSRCGSATRRASSPCARRLEVYPWLRFKLDGTPDWPGELIEQLVETGAIASIDFKGAYKGTPVDVDTDPAFYRRIAEAFPDAWLEDPDLTDPEADAVLEPHRDRITWDAPIHSVADIEALAFPPKTVNVKPSRFGSVEALFAGYDYCDAQGIEMYGGGQIELGVGRGQIQLLASLFHPDGVNDIAPSGYDWAEFLRDLEPSPLDPTRADRHAPAAIESRARCRPSSARSGWRASQRSPRCRSSRAAPTRSSRPRRASAPRRRRSSARAPPSGWTRSARASTSAPRSPPPARRSGCSCAAWPRRRWRWPSAARPISRPRPRSSARPRPPTASCSPSASWASWRRPRARASSCRIRGILLIIFLVIALLALGWGIIQLVSLPFGGIDKGVSIFWGFLLVCVVLGVLFLFGRRRQKRAREKQAEQRAQAATSGRR